jgi:hypothetical protein
VRLLSIRQREPKRASVLLRVCSAKFIEAAETMASIEADEVACAKVERAGQSVSHKLAHAFSRRALKLDDVIHKCVRRLRI